MAHLAPTLRFITPWRKTSGTDGLPAKAAVSTFATDDGAAAIRDPAVAVQIFTKVRSVSLFPPTRSPQEEKGSVNPGLRAQPKGLWPATASRYHAVAPTCRKG